MSVKMKITLPVKITAMIKDQIVLYKETKYVPVITQNYYTKNVVTETDLEKELERALNLGIEEKALFKHKIVPNKTLEITGFQLNPANIFVFKNELNLIKGKVTTPNFGYTNSFTISEIIDDYEPA